MLASDTKAAATWPGASFNCFSLSLAALARILATLKCSATRQLANQLPVGRRAALELRRVAHTHTHNGRALRARRRQQLEKWTKIKIIAPPERGLLAA